MISEEDTSNRPPIISLNTSTNIDEISKIRPTIVCLNSLNQTQTEGQIHLVRLREKYKYHKNEWAKTVEFNITDDDFIEHLLDEHNKHCQVCVLAVPPPIDQSEAVSSPVQSEPSPIKQEITDSDESEQSLSNEQTSIKELQPQSNQCKECGKTFKTYSNLKHHELTHLEDRPFKCIDCCKDFQSMVQLKSHSKRHRERLHKCNFCDKAFLNSFTLKTHLRTHTKERPFKCTECIADFTEKCHLSRHMRIHTNFKPHKCQHCSKEYSQKHDLRRHLESHGKVEEEARKKHANRDILFNDVVNRKRVYNCKSCGVVSANQTEHKAHLDQHRTDGTLLSKEEIANKLHCKGCDKYFISQLNLNRHKCKCPDEIIQCRHCSKTFEHRANLHNHEKIHSELRPYKCEHCPKSFNNAKRLKLHTYIHTKEKPYKCDECESCFTEPCHLSRHKKIHRGIKSHVCHICGRPFREKSTLTAHIRTHKQ